MARDSTQLQNRSVSGWAYPACESASSGSAGISNCRPDPTAESSSKPEFRSRTSWRRPPEMDTAPRIRVLLADDHSIVREGLAAVIALEDDMEVIGQAGDGCALLD